MENNYLNFEEQCELVKKSLAGNENALNKLIMFTYPFIAKLAGSYMHYGCEFEDLVQEGYFAVYLALPKYRPEFKAKFSTYVIWHIRKRMNLYAHSQRMIQVPPLKIEKLKAYRSLLNETDSSGQPLTDTQMAELLEMNEKEYQLLKNIPVSFITYQSQIDGIAAKEPSINNLEDMAILNVIVKEALDQLTEKERYVVCRYYQLLGHEKKMTLEDISKDLHCSKEWVRQLLISAKAKLNELLEDVKDM